MTTQTIDRPIDHGTLSHLIETGAVEDAHVVGGAGGWHLTVRAGNHRSYVLTAQRAHEAPRVFKKMDTLISYLHKLGIHQFGVDSAAYAPLRTTQRPDRSAALKEAHEAAARERHIRETIEARVRHADSPDAEWVSHADVKQRREQRRADLLAGVSGAKT